VHDHDKIVSNRPNMTPCKIFKDDEDDIEAAITDKTKTDRTYQYKPRTRMQTVIQQTQRKSLHLYMRGSTLKKQEPLSLYTDIMK
jgi:hypothetical protein